MKDTVGIAELKAHLSEYLRAVRGGRTLTVIDRGTPIARILPVEGVSPLVIRRPAAGGKGLAGISLPPALRLDVDAVALLAEERGER